MNRFQTIEERFFCLTGPRDIRKVELVREILLPPKTFTSPEEVESYFQNLKSKYFIVNEMTNKKTPYFSWDSAWKSYIKKISSLSTKYLQMHKIGEENGETKFSIINFYIPMDELRKEPSI